jgi:hypothetical protein
LRAAGEIQQRDSRSAPEPTGQERNDEIH